MQFVCLYCTWVRFIHIICWATDMYFAISKIWIRKNLWIQIENFIKTERKNTEI